MNDCPICVEGLGFPNQVNLGEAGADHDVTENVFRLKCGHAFHCNCIVRQLRLKNECPVCRDQGPQQNQFTIAITNQTITIPLNELFQEDNTNNVVNAPVWNNLHQMNDLRRTNGRVQRQRSHLNRVIHEQTELEKILLDERAHILRNSLQKFEKDWHPRQDHMCRKLQRELRKTRRIEFEELSKKEGPAQAQTLFNDLNLDAYEQSVRSVARRHIEPILDPSRRSFWRR